MIKRYHEAPKAIFKDVQRRTNGDYALVNLFDDEEYYHLFDPEHRSTILDNGVFELGKAFNPDVFAGWVEKFKPEYYIVPDVLEDADATIDSFFNFIRTYKGLPGKVLGVAQGNSYSELVKCYKAIEPYCDKVGISFDYSWYQHVDTGYSKYMNAAVGRYVTLTRLEADNIINKYKPHHLLGVMLPQEMKSYSFMQNRGHMCWIDSVDTSNPVVHGLKGIRYGANGLESKESQKLYTMIHEDVSRKQKEDIYYNIEQFRRYCNGLV